MIISLLYKRDLRCEEIRLNYLYLNNIILCVELGPLKSMLLLCKFFPREFACLIAKFAIRNSSSFHRVNYIRILYTKGQSMTSPDSVRCVSCA